MKKLKRNVKEINNLLIDPIVNAAAAERPNRALESDAQYTKRMKNQINESFLGFKKRFENGISILERDKKLPQDERLSKATKMLNSNKRWIEMNQLSTLQQSVGFSDEELATFFEDGRSCYDKGAFDEASDVFLVLTQLNPTIGAFWTALGAAEEKKGEIEDAKNVYLIGAELESLTLAPYLHGAKCLLMLNQVEQAKFVLRRAIERAHEEEQLKPFLETAEKMLNAI